MVEYKLRGGNVASKASKQPVIFIVGASYK